MRLSRKNWIGLTAGLLSGMLVLTAGGCAPPLQRFSTSFLDVFDTASTIVGYAVDQQTFDQQADDYHDLLERYNQLYDIYNEYDGINNLKTVNDNAGIAPVTVDQEIIDLLLFGKEIYEFATTIPFEEISFLLEGAKMNRAVSQEGLRGDYGLRVGKAFSGALGGLMQPTLGGDIVAAAAAASDARMDGCPMPVMTTGGSGNQGISCTVAATALAEKLGKSDEELARALALSDLITVHIKSYIGRLSPLCGSGIAGGTGSCCAMIYLMGGKLPQIERGIQSMLANHMGMICDGAKTTCALKIATGIQSAVLCATLAMQDISPTEKEGIVCKDMEETIRGVGLLSNEGVPQLDPTILQVMLNK